jgi:hypothetical protein
MGGAKVEIQVRCKVTAMVRRVRVRGSGNWAHVTAAPFLALSMGLPIISLFSIRQSLAVATSSAVPPSSRSEHGTAAGARLGRRVAFDHKGV